MPEDVDSCPNCGEKIAQGVFKSNLLLPAGKTRAINDYQGTNIAGVCGACGPSLFANAAPKLQQERRKLRSRFAERIEAVPILSLHSPAGWEYRALGIVTAQSTTGTGLFSDIASAWTDAFGMQSGTYNRKIRAGEDLCKRSLRLAALEAGGNAIVAADIDYAEVGGSAAMLMVCMTGTAIDLHNPDILGAGCRDELEELSKMHTRLSDLDRFDLEDF